MTDNDPLIGFSWCVHESHRAHAQQFDTFVSFRITTNENGHWSPNITLHLDADDMPRARMIAAAFNSDLAELRRLLDVADAAAMRADDRAESARAERAAPLAEYLEAKGETAC